MARRASPRQNEFRCTIELNQSGKYCVRIRAAFGRRQWVLPVFFMTSSFDRAMKKLEQSLQYLQKQEERLWFWGVDRSDDPAQTAEMLKEASLRLDRRGEFPRKSAQILMEVDRPVPAFLLTPVRRTLADSIQQPRPALASD